MRKIVVSSPEHARRSAWKNGRGVTLELAVWPSGATLERMDFEWRISASAIEETGPFSSFAGFDRILVVTHGDGIVLNHGEDSARSRVRQLEPYVFEGDWTTEAELSHGRVEDLNVVYRRPVWRADVEV